MVVRPRLPVSRPPASSGISRPPSRPMRRLKKRYGRVAAAGGQPGAGAAGERERAGALEEEVALLGEEQVEAGQVDLLFVHLDLREVGVHRQVGGEVLGEPVLDVAADAGVGVAASSGGCTVRSVVSAAERVRLQLDGAAADRRFQAGERARPTRP